MEISSFSPCKALRCAPSNKISVRFPSIRGYGKPPRCRVKPSLGSVRLLWQRSAASHALRPRQARAPRAVVAFNNDAALQADGCFQPKLLAIPLAAEWRRRTPSICGRSLDHRRQDASDRNCDYKHCFAFITLVGIMQYPAATQKSLGLSRSLRFLSRTAGAPSATTENYVCTRGRQPAQHGERTHSRGGKGSSGPGARSGHIVPSSPMT